MREILFRGKRVDNGEWAYGYYAESHRSMNSKIKPHKAWIVESFASNGGWLTPMIRRAIYDETVGQYTGLTDENDKRIFEKDIIRYNNEIFVIEYCEDFAAYTLKSPCNMRQAPPITSITTRNFEIIGNIFDNSLEELQNGN